MCGIAGFVGIDDKTLLRKMCNVLRQRGPDSEGYFTDEGVSLGVRRLSIIDLTKGDQPIYNEDRSIVVVSNGEIYNFIELRKRLEELGHSFYTDSDTEVIVHAYEEYGEQCLESFNGMFAFGLWDSQKRLLLLARDRLGEKPLYYSLIDDVLFFGSEIKAILENEEYKRRLDLGALWDYLSLLYVPYGETIFQGIKELEPGHLLKLHQNSVEIKQYWDLSFRATKLNEGECLQHVRDLLRDSVRLRLRSDVPVGVFLSGGIDSSTVAFLASAVKQPIQTFTIGFREQQFSEIPYARRVAEVLGSDHHEKIVEADAFKLLPKVIGFYDEPFANPTSIIHYLISEFASKTVKVALSGAGGDEVFAGYPKYTILKVVRHYVTSFPRVIREPIEKAILKLPESSDRHRLLRMARGFIKLAREDPVGQYASLLSYFDKSEKRKLCSSSCLGQISDDISAKISRLFCEAKSTDFMQKVYYVEMKTFLPYNILEYTDRTSMAASLETRVPFLDHRIVELSASIPYGLKLKRLTTKYLLKKAVSGLLPKDVIGRKKMPFSPPTALWLKRDLKDLVSTYLSKEVIERRGYFDSGFIDRIVRDHFSGTRNNEMKIMGLISFELWHQRYLDGFGS